MSIQVCDDGHDSIAYDDSVRENGLARKVKCPLCVKIREVDSLEEQVMDLQDEIADLNTKSAEYLNEHQEKPTITNGEN